MYKIMLRLFECLQNNFEKIMKNPEITVLMPVYNGEKYLRLAIDSILNQTYTDFEFLIINDGSTDDSEKIILSYKDERIRYIKNEANLKLIKTLNKGIDLAKGEFIARMDCDDVAVSNRLEKQLKLFKENPDLDFISGLPIHLLKNGRVYRSYRFCSLHTEAIRFENLLEVSFCHPCIMAKTEMFKKNKYSDSPQCLHIEDFELGRRLSHNGVNMYYSKDFILYYRKNEEGISLTNRQKQIEKGFDSVKSFLHDIYSYDINKEDYFFFIEKKGWKSAKELSNTCLMLDNLRLVFFKKNNLSLIGKNEINSWVKFRKIAYWLNALSQMNKVSLYALIQLVLHIGYLGNFFVRNKIYLLVFDKIRKKYCLSLIK